MTLKKVEEISMTNVVCLFEPFNSFLKLKMREKNWASFWPWNVKKNSSRVDACDTQKGFIAQHMLKICTWVQQKTCSYTPHVIVLLIGKMLVTFKTTIWSNVQSNFNSSLNIDSVTVWHSFDLSRVRPPCGQIYGFSIYNRRRRERPIEQWIWKGRWVNIWIFVTSKTKKNHSSWWHMQDKINAIRVLHLKHHSTNVYIKWSPFI